MRHLKTVIKNNRWLKSECTPQFTSGPLVPFPSQRHHQSPPVNYSPVNTQGSRIILHVLEMRCIAQAVVTHQKTSEAAAILYIHPYILKHPLDSRLISVF